MTEESLTDTTGVLAPGTWQVDQAGSEIRFTVRTFWGLMPVKGHFERFGGSLEVRADGGAGELKIEADSLNTHNKARDKHLRSADFFDVEEHREVTFSVASLTQSAIGLTIEGSLQVGAASIPLELELELEVAVDGVDATHAKLRALTRIPRAQAGMTWNRAGMIAGEADLHVELALTRS
jgi:polyisoprenoid-binding protein YceI